MHAHLGVDPTGAPVPTILGPAYSEGRCYQVRHHLQVRSVVYRLLMVRLPRKHCASFAVFEPASGKPSMQIESDLQAQSLQALMFKVA